MNQGLIHKALRLLGTEGHCNGLAVQRYGSLLVNWVAAVVRRAAKERGAQNHVVQICSIPKVMTVARNSGFNEQRCAHALGSTVNAEALSHNLAAICGFLFAQARTMQTTTNS